MFEKSSPMPSRIINRLREEIGANVRRETEEREKRREERKKRMEAEKVARAAEAKAEEEERLSKAPNALEAI